MEPPLEGNRISPVPIDTEATIAPGPKNRNHFKGFRDNKAKGGVAKVLFLSTVIF